MKKLVALAIFIATPAFAQGKRVDVCAPIGRTADGALVYSMKCDNLPAPPPRPLSAAPSQGGPAAVVEPSPEPEAERSGVFGLSFRRNGDNVENPRGNSVGGGMR